MSLTNIFRNISGEIEIGRTLLVSAAAAAILSPLVFQFLDMAHNGWKFDVTAWCLAYDGGLVALVGGGVLAISGKDRNVAVAKQTQAATDAATGAQA